MVEEEKKFTPDEAAVISESVKRSERLINEKLKGVSWLMAGVVIVLFIGFITLILMVGGLLLDAWHFNSAVYKEYSEEVTTLESIQKRNEMLLETNKQNQQIIIDQLKQIQETLKKK